AAGAGRCDRVRYPRGTAIVWTRRSYAQRRTKEASRRKRANDSGTRYVVRGAGGGPGKLRAHYRAVEERARAEPGSCRANRTQYDVQAAMQTRATSFGRASVACVGLRQWSGPTSGREVAIPCESRGNGAWVYGLVRDEVVRRRR